MKNRTLLDSFNNAINGILYTVKTERNMKIHIASAVAVFALSLVYKISKEEFLAVCLSVGAVIICELFNTAIEWIVDIIVDVYHPKAKIIKDAAAGAVLVSAIMSAVVGYIIFIDRLATGVESGIEWIRNFPMYIIVLALTVTVVLVILTKAWFETGTPLKGGMPSGHAAISFSITTAIALWTNDAKITILCLVIALLVVQSRLEGKIHSAVELGAGALFGVLITLILFQIF